MSNSKISNIVAATLLLFYGSAFAFFATVLVVTSVPNEVHYYQPVLSRNLVCFAFGIISGIGIAFHKNWARYLSIAFALGATFNLFYCNPQTPLEILRGLSNGENLYYTIGQISGYPLWFCIFSLPTLLAFFSSARKLYRDDAN